MIILGKYMKIGRGEGMIKDENQKKFKDENEEILEEETTENECSEGCNEKSEDVSEEVNEEKSEEDVIKSLKDENIELKSENKKLQNELKALQDRLSRINSEYENFRNRTEREKKEIYNDSCSDVLKHILPVFDNLERAMIAEGSEEDLKKGIEITMKQFERSFEKLEIEELPSEGEFDPNYHNAIMHIEDDNYGKNQVVEVFQKGFKRKDKVLRFSMVKVAN
ncbi:heat shock protein GrpE [Clostridium botulinum]|uniref:Protein GrpE n=2 Tax=Clostridium botulinum TaxID=1491 RepID=A0A9Q1UZS9_CLOBO|nr:nucleotide exchange factor GrpE [Clostridium botulinum]AEB76508.1 co-chaperone GrpE [Clostridium botulinum BKT015925]KLU76110.1 heat shock protein GrpE [Clostridium botulinum V891]KOA74043.1 heat shock protein GrpE [Clostridium botulinum]KOA75421.1 heat shock protein GrpE [Clostridium botulinum]KOA84915.1 heat shock protein GrpE [Clostridium botulinum]